MGASASASAGVGAGGGTEYASASNATNATFAKGQAASSGSDKRRTDLSGAQAWDATTYHGLLAILKEPNAPIAASCAAVEECLALNKDNLRGFFEQCFAPLMANVFGYDQTYLGRGGWVNRVAFEVQAGRGGRSGVAKSPGATTGSGQGGTGRHVGSASNDVLALRRLFAPKGRLFMAMYNADCDGTIKYHFPMQRLPGMSQMLLRSGHPLLRCWPQYAGQALILDSRGAAGAGQEGLYGPHSPGHGQQTHVHVSVFQYFFYWFAFYANSSLSSESREYGSSAMHTFGKRMLHPLSRSVQGSYSSGGLHNKKSMYLVLLRDLLHEFMPRPIDTREEEGLAGLKSSKNPLVSSYQDRPGTGMLMYSILIEFWLKDAYEPWLRDGKGKGASASWGASYDPPVENLLDAIEELTKYVMVYQMGDGNVPAQGSTSWLAASPVLYEPADMMMGGGGGSSGQDSSQSADEGAGGWGGRGGGTGTSSAHGYGNGARFGASSSAVKSIALQGPRSLGASASIGPQAYARQLYRMMHRALSLWPDQRSIKPFLRVFMVVLEPWRVGNVASKGGDAGRSSTYLSDLVKSVGLDGSHGSSRSRKVTEYGQEWEHHVLAHLPFYLDLVPMFLELSVSRVAARGETSVQDLVKVLKVFERSPTLVQLLQDVERDANRCYQSEPRRAEGPFAEMLPWVIDQAENWRRFSRNAGDREDGGSSLGGLGGLGAQMTRSSSRSRMSAERRTPSEPLFLAFSPGSSQVSRNRHDILSISAGILKPSSLKALQMSFDKVLPKYEGASEAEQWSDHDMDVKTGTVRKINKSTWCDAKFKGTELSKPKTSNEIAGLVNLMVFMSERINALLTLDVPVASDEIPETLVSQWLYDLRRRGAIVNLRFLADIRNVVWLTVVSFIVYWLW